MWWINVAQASSSVDLYDAIVTKTGTIIDDSWELLFVALGLLVALIAGSMILGGFREIVRKIYRAIS